MISDTSAGTIDGQSSKRTGSVRSMISGDIGGQQALVDQLENGFRTNWFPKNFTYF